MPIKHQANLRVSLVMFQVCKNRPPSRGTAAEGGRGHILLEFQKTPHRMSLVPYQMYRPLSRGLKMRVKDNGLKLLMKYH